MPKYQAVWPILEKAGERPSNFYGWPMSKKFAVILTHDVEFRKGHDRVKPLMEIEKRNGFVSSFNFVPERYQVDQALRAYIVEQGFEVGVHGLNPDGKLFQSKALFDSRVNKINGYIKEWEAVGFRSPAMHHNLEWIKELDLEYDLSTFDTDPFEPQSDGVETIFPFWVGETHPKRGYVELPYTLPQDFTPYILMREKTIDIWKKKIDWIVSKGGMVLVNVHPDYLAFDGSKPLLEEFPAEMYEELLQYIQIKYKDDYWNALPRNMARFWKRQVFENSN
jgi:peptidoglycan/xylan/chitin deacetylase (PgdA/CDA1 family)